MLFGGLAEAKDENCNDRIKAFLRERLQLNHNIVIDRAHRLGKFQRDGCRVIIVAFRDFTDTQLILSNARLLKGTCYSINKDYPREITTARKALWGEFKDLKRNSPDSRVSMAYPAKIIKDGKVMRDAFPCWDDILRRDRITVNTQKFSSVNTQSHRAARVNLHVLALEV